MMLWFEKGRKGKSKRKTQETDISVNINIDGKGTSDVKTGIGFLNHMLTLLAKHALFDLNVNVKKSYFTCRPGILHGGARAVWRDVVGRGRGK